MARLTSGRSHLWCAVAVLALFCILSCATAGTVLPQPDEAVYSNPGYNLLYNHHSGTTLYELRGFMPMSLGRRTYWQFPLYFLVTSLWFRIAGFGLWQVRLFSTLFGLLGLVSWYWIARILSCSATAGLLAMTIVSIDFFYILSASTGRMDMMCCGLGAASIATYLLLRERSRAHALFWSHVFATLCILTHPTGILYWLGLVFLILKFDRHSLSIRTLAAGVAPALLGISIFGAFVLQDTHSFLEQMRSTLVNNIGAFERPGLSSIPIIRQVQLEWQHRYLEPFGLGPGLGAAQRLKAIILAAYFTAVLGGLCSRRMRQQRGQVALSILTLIAVLNLALVSPSKYFYYLPHITTFLAACLGVFLYSLYRMLGRIRWIAVVAGVFIAGIQLAGILYRIRQDPYHQSYLPVVRLIRTNTTPRSIIMSTGEMWFYLQHDRFMVYDPRLGYLSGTVPNVVVWGSSERQMHEAARVTDPALFEHVQHVLDTGHLIYQDQYYQVYLR